MADLKLGLANNVRSTSIELLQTALVDLIDLRLAVKQAHWTVRGGRFQQLHELFDSFVAPLDEEIDTIAERIATLGGIPDGRASTVSASSSLEVYPQSANTGNDHLIALANRFSTLGCKLLKSIVATDEVGDPNTADIFTSASRYLEKSAWFLQSHLMPEQEAS